MVHAQKINIKGEEDDDDLYAEAGFMFDAAQPTTRMEFKFNRKPNNSQDAHEKQITMLLDCIDDDPGSVQSGHYVWPASPALAQYLLDDYSANIRITTKTTNIIELGCGCGLAGLMALHLHSPNSRIIFTDHDPGTLNRARVNFETNKSHFKSSSTCEPLAYFEHLAWGDQNQVESFMQVKGITGFDIVLGSDLIYSMDVVSPLLQTVAQLLQHSMGIMFLSQSFIYDDATEECIESCCAQLHLTRKIIIDLLDGNQHRTDEAASKPQNIGMAKARVKIQTFQIDTKRNFSDIS